MLIDLGSDHVAMFGYVLLMLLLLVGPLAYVAGADSRIDDRSSRRYLRD